MKRTVEVSYQCSICKNEYDTKREALKCERGKNEPRKFSGGDFVKTNVQLVGDRPVGHYCCGKIINYKLRRGNPPRAVPPKLPQERNYGHIWEYEFRCTKRPANCSAFQCDLNPFNKLGVRSKKNNR